MENKRPVQGLRRAPSASLLKRSIDAARVIEINRRGDLLRARARMADALNVAQQWLRDPRHGSHCFSLVVIPGRALPRFFLHGGFDYDLSPLSIDFDSIEEAERFVSTIFPHMTRIAGDERLHPSALVAWY